MNVKAPQTIKLLVCPICGRHDRYTPFTGRSHFKTGGKCSGTPEEIVYRIEMSEEPYLPLS